MSVFMESPLRAAVYRLPLARRERLASLHSEVFTRGARRTETIASTDLAELVLDARPFLPEVLFCGESNSGKSTAIRHVFGAGKFAGVARFGAYGGPKTTVKPSGRAGRTREISKTNCSGVFHLVDTPGYGTLQKRAFERRSRVQGAIPYLTALSRQYISAMAPSLLHRVYLLVPAHAGGLSHLDEAIASDCAQQGVPLTVMLSKADTVTTAQLHKLASVVRDQAPVGEVLPFSSADADMQRDVQLDVLHSVTRWLDDDDLVLRRLQGMEYSRPAASPDELLAVMDRISRPAASGEERVEELRRAGLRFSGGEGKTAAVQAAYADRHLEWRRRQLVKRIPEKDLARLKPRGQLKVTGNVLDAEMNIESFLGSSARLEKALGSRDVAPQKRPKQDALFGAADNRAMQGVRAAAPGFDSTTVLRTSGRKRRDRVNAELQEYLKLTGRRK